MRCPQDGARLGASIETPKASVAEVAAEMMVLQMARSRYARDTYGDFTIEALMENVEVDPKDASNVMVVWEPHS